jgi:VWFA-related protein
MTRPALLVLALLLPLAVQAEPVEWEQHPAAALEIAQRDGRMLLVYYRLAVGGRTADSDRAVALMSADELFVHSLDAFVPLRIEAASAPTHPVVEALRKERQPLLAIYDASGLQLARFPKLGAGWKTIAEDVLRFRSVRGLAAQSASLRLGGETAAADFILGYLLRSVARLPESIAAFERAAEVFQSRDDEESEQLARLGAASSRYAYGQKQPARLELSSILQNPVTQNVEAEAQLLWGGILESIAHTPVSVATRTRTGRNQTRTETTRATPASTNPTALSPAIAAYRKAYQLALPDSATEATARLALERLDKAPLPSKGTVAGNFAIIPPARTTFTGHSQFAVEAPAGTTSVQLFLDEQLVATMTRSPYRAAIDVGSTPRMRVVKARAWDASKQMLGETTITINDRLDNFYVTIVSPATTRIEGRVNAEADVKAPQGREIESVVLSWNGTPFATLDTPPFRAAVDVSAQSLGYLHARATLDDGTTAEATRVYNAKLMETVEVGAVTVLAAVADRDGEPLRGLSANAFVISDEGKQVEHELLSSDDDPVTIGLAIDSSSSMEGRQLYALRAATTFLERALRPVDQAFVVAFDTRVSLIHERSGDVASLRASILDLMPAGGTSLFDGVTFALQQFQGIPGRKALVVVSDGREGTSSASAREAERLARSVGVPIYLVVPPAGERIGHALRSLSDLTGGTMFHAIPEKDFTATFDRLASELRAQYVLQFRMPPGVAEGTWRTIEVALPGREAVIRTIAGYRAN